MTEEIIIPVVVAGIIEMDRILLLKRNRDPFKGMWSLPGGKIAFDEFVTHAIEREVMEETGLCVAHMEFLGIVSELLKENRQIRKGHLISVFRVSASRSELRNSVEGDLRWFDSGELKESKHQVIPTDFLIATNMLYPNKHVSYICLVRKEGKVYTVEEFGEV